MFFNILHFLSLSKPKKGSNMVLRKPSYTAPMETVPLTSTATGTGPFLAPLPAPGAQGPAQLTTQWASRMRGTAGHPEIALLVRNQKGNQKEPGRGERMGTERARERRRVGMAGWSGSGCVWSGRCLCVCPCGRQLQSDECLAPMQKPAPACTRDSLHTHCWRLFSRRGQDVFQVIKAGTATVGQKEDRGQLMEEGRRFAGW